MVSQRHALFVFLGGEGGQLMDHGEGIKNSQTRMDLLAQRMDATGRDVGTVIVAVSELSCFLKQGLQDIRHDAKELRSEVKEVKLDVKGLKADVKGLKSDVKGLKTDVTGLKADVKGLKTDINELRTDVEVLRNDLKTVGAHVASDSTKVDAMYEIMAPLAPPCVSKRK
eukprot:TRINITY_DN403_c0_g1_i3.p2 TRINITY_DN403_c0_g1~~TRINITY_DN403_c0_g1_i3.p2  ORF type:complete len:169 (+),score=24.56 TRINITY_DN403_c0_g1_i3:56-562(+)